MSLNFPDAPSINDEYSAEGRTWTWDGTAWLANETKFLMPSADIQDIKTLIVMEAL
jgi:hypothetical protein